jgi:uncharacterized protein YbbC (DUF1343 family)
MSFLQNISSVMKVINISNGEILNFPQVKLFTPLKETMDNFNNHEETICNLKILCKIQKGEKLNVKYKFVQQDDVVTKLIRTFYYKDNRINTLTFIRATIKQCFDIITLYKNSDKEHERIISKNILQDLKESRQGISNLKDTYIGDISFSCHLDTLLQEMNARLTEYEGFE